ncbi:SAM-dependent methyltransferase [Synechococcus sp. CBW1107]|uniref:SAM-dependent methyltransferase n=1 Tax=Synechococcus sp. CBW1107 TaxID=2789857 RepID=UPI002AD3EEBB|nr:SAM-dependent methyltransferase [Synechococcus sp. CBW1107]CAK6694604.1 hypothetical protein MNNICLKF_01661 [Synechococcus sp. CBW1107]
MTPAEPSFSTRVEHCFSRSAPAYQRGATLQAAVAARLARLTPPLPGGTRVDLGAGNGLLARAIEAQAPGQALLRLDACLPLLEQDPLADPALRRQWDLNRGLPEDLQNSALLASSFALQWLEQPVVQLRHWCDALRGGGALLLAVPCQGSFSLWHQAAEQADVPCTALALPEATQLIEATQPSLQLHQGRVLRFSRPNPGAVAFLQQIKAIGAQASRAQRLKPSELRRLIRHWPGPEQSIVWHVLVLMGQKR